jgi:hypothetical protein
VRENRECRVDRRRACVNGRERSLPEFDALLHRAGLRRTAVLTADLPQSVIEAVAA